MRRSCLNSLKEGYQDTVGVAAVGALEGDGGPSSVAGADGSISRMSHCGGRGRSFIISCSYLGNFKLRVCGVQSSIAQDTTG